MLVRRIIFDVIEHLVALILTLERFLLLDSYDPRFMSFIGINAKLRTRPRHANQQRHSQSQSGFPPPPTCHVARRLPQEEVLEIHSSPFVAL